MFDEVVAPWTFLFISFNKVPDVDPGGWGAVPLGVTLKKSTWRTSIFPLKKEGYLLPVKKPILKKEGLKSGDKITVKYFTTRGNF